MPAHGFVPESHTHKCGKVGQKIRWVGPPATLSIVCYIQVGTATSIRNGSKKKDWFEGISTYGQDLEVFNLLVVAQSQYERLWITLAVTEQEQPVEWKTSN